MIRKKGQWTSIGYEDAGAQTARDAVLRLTEDRKLDGYVENMVKMHMRPHNIPLTLKPKSTNRMFDESVSPEDLLLLFHCDTGREVADDKHMERIWWLESRLERYDAAIQKPEVTAEDLAAFWYGPGRLFLLSLQNADRCTWQKCQRRHSSKWCQPSSRT